ncbi:MAG: hypothetical protein D3924_05140 [Candidatus Electrothrix sp. AR4]|nr:hypothetical protein [Candidatus Electrothrix sp. AR4]
MVFPIAVLESLEQVNYSMLLRKKCDQGGGRFRSECCGDGQGNFVFYLKFIMKFQKMSWVVYSTMRYL